MSTTTRLPWEKAADGMRVAWVDQEMWVAFAHSNTWKFTGIPKCFYDDLLKAANSRRYFRAHIVGRFDHERLETP